MNIAMSRPFRVAIASLAAMYLLFAAGSIVAVGGLLYPRDAQDSHNYCGQKYEMSNPLSAGAACSRAVTPPPELHFEVWTWRYPVYLGWEDFGTFTPGGKLYIPLDATVAALILISMLRWPWLRWLKSMR